MNRRICRFRVAHCHRAITRISLVRLSLSHPHLPVLFSFSLLPVCARILKFSSFGVAERVPSSLKSPPEYLCHGKAPTWALTERRRRLSCVRFAAGILENFRFSSHGRRPQPGLPKSTLGRNTPRGPRLSSECESQGPSLVLFSSDA